MISICQQDLIVQLQALAESGDQSVVIGISGYGGSGKSTFARDLSSQILDSFVIGVDQYYVLEKDALDDNWDCFDRSLMRGEVQRHLGRAKLIICEGVGIFHPDTADQFSIRIWVDLDLETATSRGMKRDREVQGQNHDHLWREIWEPNERRFEAKHDPRSKATHFLNGQ